MSRVPLVALGDVLNCSFLPFSKMESSEGI